jgi:hypothetical protein
MNRLLTQSLLLATLATGLAAAQDASPPSAPARGAERHKGGQIDAAFKLPDDPRIPAPADLTPATDSRLFVESFVVGLMGRTPGVVYGTYLDEAYRGQFTEDAFTRATLEARQVLGGLQRMVVLHLREEGEAPRQPAGGYAEYILVFEKDPRVEMRVDFHRDSARSWRVSDYTLRSPLLERLAQARAAAARTADPAPKDAPQTKPAAPPVP